MKFLVSRARHLFLVACLASAVAATALEAQAKQQGNVPTPSTQNVNVVNTPTVNVGTLPAVSFSGTPSVNVGSLPPVSLLGTPNVNIAGSSAILAVQNIASTASQNVNLFNGGTNVPAQSFANLVTSNSVAAFSVPAGQTLMITDIDISPAAPGTGTNHVGILAEPNTGAAEITLRDFKVSNATSSLFTYHTGIAVSGGSTGTRILVVNGVAGGGLADGTLSSGPVYVSVNGYLTTN